MKKYKYYITLMGLPKGSNNSIRYTDYWCEYNHPLETEEEITQLLEGVKEKNNLSCCFITNVIKLKR